MNQLNKEIDNIKVNEDKKLKEEVVDSENGKQEEKIENIEKQRDRARIVNIILIIIIIILLLLLLVGCNRIGKIGYDTEEVSGEVKEEDETEIIRVYQKDLRVTKNTRLDIFNNKKFNGEKKIAPKSGGSYRFAIKNVTDGNITYNIGFTDEMSLPVNMKYRLKIDNIYVRGNKQQYVNLEDLNLLNVIVLKDSINIFTLEWYWEDDDVNDTFVGSQEDNQYYTLNLRIDAKEYNT